jgi:alpha-L-rhamnosidase
MWFVIELEEYLQRSGDTVMVDALRPKVMALLDYFRKFENADGLLEKLDKWVFIEWSQANKFVQDVNYPTNMTYSATLDAAGRMYNQALLQEKAQKLREEIRKQSFDGEFFVDNAMREDGILKITRNRTEVCQYYAFFTGTATPELYPELWRRLYTDFGPQRAGTQAFPEIHKANAFIGNFLRLELLGRGGLCRQVKDELAGYFLAMAEKTGTLWELDNDRASCNHGFAGHAAHSICRDVLGVSKVDTVMKVIELRIADTGLNWCRGSMPVPGGRLRVSWKVGGECVMCRAEAPAGYRLKITATDGMKLLLQ